MKVFDKRPLSVNISYAVSALMVSAVMIDVWSITTIAINKETVFTGPQLVWTAISLLIFFLFNVIGMGIAIWVRAIASKLVTFQ